MSRPRRPRRTVSGILLLDKPSGISSNDALMQVRRLYQAEKAGHTGSLDPLATGLLPICLGQATKLCGQLLASDKAYRATVVLGTATDTGDADGAAVSTAPLPPHTADDIAAVLKGFIGLQRQTPPMYSAIKQGGTRLYALAREGQVVDREPRNIIVHELQLVSATPSEWVLDVRCSKGTYIRVLAEDIARALGTVAHLGGLRRTGVAPFSGRLWTLEALAEQAQGGLPALDALLLPVAAALVDWPAWTVDAAEGRCLRRGQPLPVPGLPPGPRAVYGPDRQALCLGEVVAGAVLWPRRWLSDDPQYTP